MADPPRPPARGGGGGGIFGAKVFGIPVVLLVVAAGAALWWWRKQQAANAATTAAAGSTDTTAAGSAPNLLGGAIGGGGAGGITATGTGTGSFADNNAWYNAALNALTAAGYDPLAAASALGSYLGGGQLSTQAQALVDTALGRVGAPPNAPQVNTTITTCPPGSYYDPITAGCLPLPGSGPSQSPPSAPGSVPTPVPPPSEPTPSVPPITGGGTPSGGPPGPSPVPYPALSPANNPYGYGAALQPISGPTYQPAAYAGAPQMGVASPSTPGLTGPSGETAAAYLKAMGLPADTQLSVVGSRIVGYVP